MHATAMFLKDVGTLVTALTFGLNELAKLISKLRAVEGPMAESSVIAGVQSYHVIEFSLESYCRLIRCLYTGTIELKVDLNEFAIGSPPNKPFILPCKGNLLSKDYSIQMPPLVRSSLLHIKAAAAILKVHHTSFGELEEFADVHADFPLDKGFYVKSRASGLVLDVDHGFGRDHTLSGANIGLDRQKLYCSSAHHALWSSSSGALRAVSSLTIALACFWMLTVRSASHTAKADKRISNEYESRPLARVHYVEQSPQKMQLKEVVLVFHCDIYSVDTQFVFKPADKMTSNTRL
ncbi:hypothetical protein BGZ92_006691 [Podila epicladia]|nr:hypothetical protein BGZ92_006691 [Podila epicladia]